MRPLPQAATFALMDNPSTPAEDFVLIAGRQVPLAALWSIKTVVSVETVSWRGEPPNVTSIGAHVAFDVESDHPRFKEICEALQTSDRSVVSIIQILEMLK